VTRSSETSVYNKPTRRHMPEDVILHSVACSAKDEHGRCRIGTSAVQVRATFTLRSRYVTLLAAIAVLSAPNRNFRHCGFHCGADVTQFVRTNRELIAFRRPGTRIPAAGPKATPAGSGHCLYGAAGERIRKEAILFPGAAEEKHGISQIAVLVGTATSCSWKQLDCILTAKTSGAITQPVSP
jgi:hypothetical protein